MVPFPVNSLEPTYNAFKSYYTSKNGSTKFEKIFDTVSNSPLVNNAFLETAQRRVAPSGTDFFELILSLRYFIFAKNETRALGAVIALKIWEERVNQVYKLATPESIDYKLEIIMKKLNLI
jgi:hypothetical protein